MTKEDWFKNPTFAEELAKALENPALKVALDIIERDTMASAVGGTSILESTNLNVYFGCDLGRAQVLKDLRFLASVPKPTKVLKPNYSSEKQPTQ